MRPFRIFRVFGFILLGIAGLFIFSAVVMLLWNNLLTVLFHFPVVSLWQALGILVLAKLLFGGFHGGPGRGHHWNRKMRGRWMNMTPEEREKFKQEWKSRCGVRYEDRPFEEEKPAQ